MVEVLDSTTIVKQNPEAKKLVKEMDLATRVSARGRGMHYAGQFSFRGTPKEADGRTPEDAVLQDEAVEGAPGPPEKAQAREQRERVRQAVRRLPLKYREVIVLRYLEGLAYDEVAASLNITSAAARRRALRAREMLRGRLAGLGGAA